MSVKGVDNTFRRTWDKQVFEKKAQERLEKEEEEEQVDLRRKEKVYSLKDMKPAQARDQALDFDGSVGKAIVIASTADVEKLGGFYCEACDCTMKDSQNYLDHINGKKHQRALGSSLKPERATLAQVRARLKLHKEKNLSSSEISQREDRMERLNQLEQQKTVDKKNKKKGIMDKKREEKKKALEQEADPALMAFGLPIGFGSSKK